MLNRIIFGCVFCLFVNHSAFSQINLELLAHVPNDSAVSLAGCWHYVDSTGGEYALVGTSIGLDIWDVSSPSQPERLFQISGVVSNWREVRPWNGYAYIGSEGAGSGITILDLQHLPDSIRWKVWTGNDSLANKIQRSHTVNAVDGYLYIFGSTAPNDGAIICSLEDPWNPDFVGQYKGAYLHDGYIQGDTLWGSEIYNGQVSAIDISDKTAPFLLASQETPGKFNHNSGLSKDRTTLFTTDEKFFSPVASFDVSDLDNITLLDRYFPSQKPTQMTHNVRVIGDDYIVCPSYGGQLTIVDASEPDNLVETAWAILGTSLVWDADPYLPSGIVFATAKNEGLFIFKPTYQRAARLRGLVTNQATGVPLSDAKVFIQNTLDADTSRTNGLYATGTALGGTYSILVEKQGFFPKILSGVVLTNGQTLQLDVALEPMMVAAPEIGISDTDWRIYPSLAGDFVWVDLPKTAIFPTNGIAYRVTDRVGKQVKTGRLEKSSTRLDLEGLNAGVYYVSLQKGEGTTAKSFVKR